MWLCPVPLDELDATKLESPQPNESRLRSFNLAFVIDRSISKYYPNLRCTFPEFLKGDSPLHNLVSQLSFAQARALTGNCFPPISSQTCYILVLLSTFPARAPTICLEQGLRTGSVDAGSRLAWSIQQDGASMDDKSKTDSKRRLSHVSGPGAGEFGEQGGPGPQRVARDNVRHHQYGRPTSVTRNYNPLSPEGHSEKRLRLARESPASRSESESDISLHDFGMES